MSLLLIHYGLEFYSRCSPDKIAVYFRDNTLTFSQLNTRANRVAHALLNCGLKKGDRVAAFLDNCMEYPEIIYGCSKAGMVLVPINFRLAPREAFALLEHSGAQLAFISHRLERGLGSLHGDVERLLPHGLVTVSTDADSPKSFANWTAAHDEYDPGLPIDERDLFYIGYTSGTTGTPKGVQISHRARALLMLACAIEFGLSQDDINLTPGAIYHAAPIIFMLLPINIGGSTVIMENFDAEEVLRLIEKNRVTNMFVAPTMLQLIHQLPRPTQQRFGLDSMRVIISAGAPLSTHAKKATSELFGDEVLHEFYGSTEAACNTNLRPRDQLKKPRSCGQTLPGWEVKLVGIDGEDILDTGQVGEIFVRGEFMFDGYLDNPKATEEAFRDGWFSAGDLGYFDADGYLFISGRKKDMILSGGANVYPEEVEDCLHSCPGVADVAVIGVLDETWGERVTAIVVLDANAPVSGDEIKKFCEGRIAGYKKPRDIFFVDELPRNPSGKLLKHELRERFGRGRDGDFH